MEKDILECRGAWLLRLYNLPISNIHYRNPGVRTIEEDLIQAACKAGAISEDMRDNLGKVL